VKAEEGDATLPNDEQTVKFNAINIHPVSTVRSKEDSIRIINSNTAESASKESNYTVQSNNQVTSPSSHAPKSGTKRNSLSSKWLTFLLGSIVVAAAIIVYAMMINPPKGDDTPKEDTLVINKDVQEDNFVPVPEKGQEPAQEEQESKPKRTSVKASSPVRQRTNARKVVVNNAEKDMNEDMKEDMKRSNIQSGESDNKDDVKREKTDNP
jgi:hypothetical protein